MPSTRTVQRPTATAVAPSSTPRQAGRSADAHPSGEAPVVVRFAGDDNAAWDRCMGWLMGRAKDRRDVKAAAPHLAWTMLGPGQLVVTLPRVGAVVISGHAARQVAQLADVKWPLTERLLARGSAALALLLAEEWGLCFADTPMLWRVVNGEVRAVLSEQYTPIDDIPLVRSVEPAFRAAGLVPVRAIADVERTRIEFASTPVDGRVSAHYRPGVVLQNSETGDAAVSLAPALVRRAGVANRITRGVIDVRHTLADPSACIQRLTSALPRLLADAAQVITTWDSVRLAPVPAERTPAISDALTEVLGLRDGRAVLAAWMATPDAERTPGGLYRLVAEAVRGADAFTQSATDGLLLACLPVQGPEKDARP